MQGSAVKVPGSLLRDRQLTPAAKLLWVFLQLDARAAHTPRQARAPRDAVLSPSRLAARCGLGRPSVRRGLAQLQAAGWLSAPPTARKGHAAIPVDLVLQRHISAQAKLLFARLQLIPGYADSTGRFTYPQLAGLTGLNAYTLKAAARELQDTGWLKLERRNKLSPTQFTLRNPVAERRSAAVAAARQRLEQAPFLGEALMREYLSLVIDSDEYTDNATQGFLVNPFTGEKMHYDRYYPPSVAWEFQGPQHYGPTERYSSEAGARNQLGRDYIKLGISVARGIRLVVVHAEDLTLDTMRRKAEGLLPLRSLDDHWPLIAYLEQVSRAYRRKARERWIRKRLKDGGGDPG